MYKTIKMDTEIFFPLDSALKTGPRFEVEKQNFFKQISKGTSMAHLYSSSYNLFSFKYQTVTNLYINFGISF